MMVLLRILLATDSINIQADVLPEEMPTTVLQSTRSWGGCEVIVKAISAVLLLLLKHIMLNHVDQTEYMAQH